MCLCCEPTVFAYKGFMFCVCEVFDVAEFYAVVFVFVSWFCVGVRECVVKAEY